jgi:hypothetical protein
MTDCPWLAHTPHARWLHLLCPCPDACPGRAELTRVSQQADKLGTLARALSADNKCLHAKAAAAANMHNTIEVSVCLQWCLLQQRVRHGEAPCSNTTTAIASPA